MSDSRGTKAELMQELETLRARIAELEHELKHHEQTGGTPYEREARARERIAELDNLYRTAPVGLCLLDTELRFVRVNEQLASLGGMAPAAHIGRRLRDVVPDIARRAESIYRKVIESGRPILNLEIRGAVPAQPGVERHLLASFLPLKSDDGTVHGVSTVVQDITERKEAEERLWLLSSAVEQSTEGIAVSDVDGNFLFVNDAFARMHGYAPQEILHQHLSVLHTSDQMPLVEEANREILERGEFAGECWHVRRDGRVFPTYMRESLVRDAGGRPVAVIAAARDITRRKREEGELRMLEMAVQQSIDGIAVADPDGGIRFVNPAWAHLHGYTVPELLGQHLSVFHTERQMQEDVIPFNEQVGKKGAHHGEVGHVRKDGSIFSTWMSTALLRDEQERPIGLVGVARDITERKRAKEELQRAHDELERRVAERTAELTEANKKLQEEIAERQRAEEALRKSESRYRVLFNSTDDLLAVHPLTDEGLPGPFSEINDAACKKLGYSREELSQMSTFDIEDPKPQDRIRSNIEKLIANDHVLFETAFVAKDGRRIPIEINSHLFDLEGEPTVLASARDITERKRAEEALRESEERLRTVVSASKDAMIAVDENGLVTLFNAAAEEMFGRSARDMIGGPLDCLMPHEYRRRHQERIESYFRCGEPHGAIGRTIELPAVRSNGQQFPAELSLSIGQRGGQRFALAVIRDVTKRRRVEEALVTRLRYEEGLAACSRALLSDTDADEALTRTLHILREASNVSRVYIFENFEDDKDGLCLRQTLEACAEGVAPEIDNPLLQHLPYGAGFSRWQRVLSRGEPIQGLVEEFPRSEREVLEPQDILSILVLPIASKVAWYGFIGFDDTRQRREWTEEDIRLLQTAAEMIGAFIERNRAAADLRLAKDAAEAANRAKSIFLANMSHEIRTPITAMLGAAEQLPDRAPQEDETRDRVDMILRNGCHLLSLIDDLLDLSRAEAGRLEVQRTRCSLLELMADVQAVTVPLHRHPGVDFRFTYETAVPTFIHTDPTRLKQAVINLVNNALKFTEAGYVRVRLGVDRESDPPSLFVAVEDTGPGIPARDIQRVFDTFAQVEPGSSRIRSGVGLGLPIAKWIAEQLGGRLDVTSAEGRGSTFTLHVATGPLDDADWVTPTDARATASSPRARDQVASRPRLRGKILLAEDFRDVRELIAHTLIQAGAEVKAVSNGQEAVKAATEQEFDLILMDVRMTGMDGREATAELRRRGCTTPIIALTASTTSIEHRRMREAGFDDLWRKPISLERLLKLAAGYVKAGVGDAPGDRDRPVLGSTLVSENPRMAAAVAEFVRHLPARTRSIRTLVGAGDLQQTRELLHQLVGVSGIVGYMPLSQEAARLLDGIKDGTFSGADDLLALDDLVDRITRAMPDDPSGSAGDAPASPSGPRA